MRVIPGAQKAPEKPGTAELIHEGQVPGWNGPCSGRQSLKLELLADMAQTPSPVVKIQYRPSSALTMAVGSWLGACAVAKKLAHKRNSNNTGVKMLLTQVWRARGFLPPVIGCKILAFIKMLVK